MGRLIEDEGEPRLAVQAFQQAPSLRGFSRQESAEPEGIGSKAGG
jgi:hypothetical protein